MDLRLQTWMPFNLFLCTNGREWLARQMEREGLRYLRRDNCFIWLQDCQRSQSLLQEQVDLPVGTGASVHRVGHNYGWLAGCVVVVFTGWLADSLKMGSSRPNT